METHATGAVDVIVGKQENKIHYTAFISVDCTADLLARPASSMTAGHFFWKRP
jgi:hypothetical protein